MKQTAYELLGLVDRRFEECAALLKQIATCPGQRPDILTALANEVRYVRAQVGFEVTDQASDFEMQSADHWGRIHRKHEMWLKDPDDVYLDVEEREELRKRKGLPPRVIILPWSYEEEEKLLAAKRSEARKKSKQKRQGRFTEAARERSEGDMKMKLLRELYEFNQAFERVVEGLKRMEKTAYTLPGTVRAWRADVVSILVEINREFFDEFEAALNDDEEWACKALRKQKEQDGDREDIYVQVMDREATRKKKGLSPRVTFLPYWNSGDEERYDEAQSERRERAAQKSKRKAIVELRGAAGPSKSTATRPPKRRGGR